MSTTTINPGNAVASVTNGKPGDVFVFAKDTYSLNNLYVPPGVTLDLSADPIIIAPNGAAAFRFRDGVDANTIGGQFRGASHLFDGKSRVNIDGGSVTAFDDGPGMNYGPGGFGGAGANLNGLIKGMKFFDSPNGRAISFFTSSDSLTIDDCDFLNTFLGIKTNNANRVRARNFTISRCEFQQQIYHPIECQGCVDGAWLKFNKIFNQRWTPGGNNNSHFAYSFIYTPGRAGDPGGALPSTDQHIYGNYCEGPVDAQGKPVFNLLCEHGQNIVEFDQNVMKNGKIIATFWYGGQKFGRNHAENWTQNMYELLPSGNPGYGPDATNGPTIVINSQPTPTPDPAPQPTPTMNAPTVTVVDGTRAAVKWDAVSGAGSYAVYLKTKDGTDPFVQLGKTGKTTVAIKGLKTGWEYKLNVVAYTAAGNVASPYATWRNGDIAQAGNASIPNAPAIDDGVVQPDPPPAPPPAPRTTTLNLTARLTLIDGVPDKLELIK